MSGSGRDRDIIEGRGGRVHSERFGRVKRVWRGLLRDGVLGPRVGLFQMGYGSWFSDPVVYDACTEQ